MVNYERLGTKAQAAPPICSDVYQLVREMLETKVIAQTVAAMLHVLLLREQRSCLLGQICFNKQHMSSLQMLCPLHS